MLYPPDDLSQSSPPPSSGEGREGAGNRDDFEISDLKFRDATPCLPPPYPPPYDGEEMRSSATTQAP